MDWEPLHNALRGLVPAGNGGFEGFVAACLTEITGRTFRVVKSGPQGGFDGLNDPVASGLHIGFEGKHYGEGTKLGLGALKTKIEEATSSIPDLDLWTLATTRSIDAGDRRKLRRHGHERGIEVLILDWAPAPGMPPALALICAMAPHVFRAWFPHQPDALAVVSDLQTWDMFPAMSAELREAIASPSIGYSFAKAQLDQWTIDQLATVPTAQLAFDSYANLRDPAAGPVVARRSLSAALDDWWASSGFAAVVTGAEGIGKTWGALNWVLSAATTDQRPLTVVIPARRITSPDALQSVGEGIERALECHDAAFWVRRVKRWISNSEAGTRLLVIVDGLNQNWQFTEWANWLRSFQVAPWQGRVRVLLTCRPDHWEQALRALPGMAPRVSEFRIVGFDDQELDEFLAAHGVARQDFHPSLLDLMRVPRLSRLGMHLREQLKGSGEITRERLLYEDWRHRSEGAIGRMSDTEFRFFLGKLASGLQSGSPAVALTRKDLLDRLGEDSGDDQQTLRGVMSDIVDGRWLQSTGQPHEFRLNKSALPHALALSLIYELRNHSDPKEIREHLAKRLEPYQAQDDAVGILRSAASIALFDSSISPLVRLELISRWLRSQNFSSLDFEEFWRVLGSDVSTAMSVVDHLWFGDHGHGADEVVVKAMANASKWPDVFSAIEQQLTEWFRRYWLDPMQGEFSGSVGSDARADQRRDNTRQRAGTWAGVSSEADFGWKLVEVPGSGQSWGATRAAALISWLPRASLIRPITAWAVSHAVMEHARQRDQLRWVLRWNRYDALDAEVAVIEAAQKLAGTGNSVGIRAARVLLEGLASSKATDVLAGLPPPQPREPFEGIGEVGLHNDGFVSWDYAGASAWPRCVKAPLDVTMGLDVHAVNPAARLTGEALGALHGIAGTVSDTMLRGEEPGAEHENGGLDTAALALSRWAPHLRAELEARSYRAPAAVAKDDSRPVRRRGKPDPTSRFLVLTQSDVAGWHAAAWHRRRAAATTGSGCTVGLEELSASLAGLTAGDQISRLSQYPGGPGLLHVYEPLLATPVEADYATIASLIETEGVEVVRFWLDFLLHVDLTHMPPNWTALWPLLDHDDDAIRWMAIRLAWQAEDEVLADELAKTWTLTKATTDDERINGSLVLTLAGSLTNEQKRERIHPEVLGLLAKMDPSDATNLDAFAAMVKAALGRLLDGDVYNPLLAAVGAWDLLGSQRPQELRDWLTPFADSVTAHPMSMLYPFPLRDALGTLGGIDPELTARILHRQIDDQRRSSIQVEEIWNTAMRVPGKPGDDLREVVLDAANNDKKLFDVVIRAVEGGHSDWLHAAIERDLADVSAGIAARALTLAGFLFDDEKAQSLWANLDTAPHHGWLAEVASIARARFERHQWSMHWFDRYLSSDGAEAFAAHELFVATLDRRIRRQPGLPSEQAFDAWSPQKQIHWLANANNRKSAIEQSDRKRKDILFGQRMPHELQCPRLQ